MLIIFSEITNNGLIITFELIGCVSNIISMLNKILYVVFVEGVHDIEKIITVWKTPFRHYIGKVFHDFRLLLGSWPQVSYGQLIVHWYVNKLNTVKMKKLFLLRENLPEEVFVYH